MRRARFAAAVLAALALAPAPALASKDCRSRLTSGLNALGSTGLSWNLELRGFYYGVDGTPYAFPGLGGWLRFEPSDRWSFDLEAVVRDKTYLDYERDDLSPIQLKTALLRYRDPAGRFDLSLGRQEVQLADGLIMDEFLDALQIGWHAGAFDLRAGAGVLALSAAKESLYCAKCMFFEYRSCWKGFGESSYGDFKTAFVQASASLGAAGTAGLIYQKVAAADPAFDSDTAGVYAGLVLPFRWKLGFEAALQRQASRDAYTYGFHLDLSRSWRISGLGTLQVRLQDLYGSSDESLLFSPTFGTLHLGERQHYSVRQGHTAGASIKWMPEIYRRLTLDAGYFANTADGLAGWRTDEFDLGAEWRPFGTDAARLYLGYARALTPAGPVHQLALETRFSF